MRTFLKLSLIALSSLAIVFTACQNPSAPTGTVGSLTLSITDHVSRTLVPTLSMTPVSYAVAGTGPGGASFTEDTTGTLTINKLAFGSWSVSVTAKNAGGTAIGSGTGTVVVHSNQSSTLAITVIPFTGSGTLTLGLNWTAADVETAQVESNLLPTTGDARDLAFAVDGTTGTASFAANDVATGYHTLTLKLKDNGALVMGAVEVVRVVKDQTTAGSYTFADINKPGGTMVVNITPDMGDPLTVSIAGAATTKPENQSMNLMASVTEVGVNATYVWYVNGEARGSGATYAFDDTWAQGNYRIDVTAYSADGTRAGSGTVVVQVVHTVPMTQYHRLAAGGGHSLAVDSSGNLYTFGANTTGQLGDGTLIDRPDPLFIMDDVVSVAAGGSHSLVLKNGGTLWGFGSNLEGQLGLPGVLEQLTPVQIMSDVQAIDAGGGVSLVLKNNGELWGFGDNGSGQLGLGNLDAQGSPILMMASVVSMATGGLHTLIVRADGTAWATGGNNYGQLGNGSTEDLSIPVLVQTQIRSVSAGWLHSLFLKTDGSLWSCGWNRFGQLGVGSEYSSTQLLPFLANVESIGTGPETSFAVKVDGSLWASGYNLYGQLGTLDYSGFATQVLPGAKEVSSGGNFTLILKADGGLWSVGSNYYGQLGDGLRQDRNQLQEILGWSN